MNDTTIRRPVIWGSAGASDIGAVRKINEDAIMQRRDAGLWAIADGMGGYEAGDVASRMIVEALEQLSIDGGLNDAVSAIEECILDVNRRILDYADTMLNGRTLGATIVSFMIRGQLGVCLWAGDSRLYRYRGNRLEQISRDHSRVEELLKRGMITPEEAAAHPESNVITRAVGVTTDFNLDMTVFPVQMGEIFLLCSDGLYNSVGQEGIMHCLNSDSPGDAVEGMIAMALENHAKDNVSVIVVKGQNTPFAAAEPQ